MVMMGIIDFMLEKSNANFSKEQHGNISFWRTGSIDVVYDGSMDDGGV
jgi:hypothetical protein